MGNGWISLHRKLLDNPLLKKPNYLTIWIYILLKVNHKSNKFIWNNKKMVIKEGEGIFSQLEISKKFKINIASVNRILKYFENEKQIEKQTTTKYTLIRVIKWHMYQDREKQNEKQRKNKLKTEQKQIKTNNNDNNDDNDNNDNKIYPTRSSGRKKPNPEINKLVEYFKQVLGTSLDGTVKSNRRYCWLLLQKIKKDYPNKNAVEGIKLLIKIGRQDVFHSKNLTGFGYLYRNTQKVIQSVKKKKKENIEIL